MKIAVIQMTSTENKNENIKKANHFIEEAISQKANIIALPENFPYLKIEGEQSPCAERLSGEIITSLTKIAKENSVTIIAGSIAEQIEGSEKTYNTCVAINDRGELSGIYRKIHLFDVKLSSGKEYYESHYVKAGEDVVVIESEWCKMGLAICYDLRFPELFRKLTNQGAKVIFIPSAFTMSTGKDHWEVLLRARAIENQVYIVAPNQYGRHSKGRESYGNSLIVDPWGTVLARAQNKEEVIYCNIDLDYLTQIRNKIPSLNHDKGFMWYESNKHQE